MSSPDATQAKASKPAKRRPIPPVARPLPADALQALQNLCDATTQRAVDKRLDVNEGTVSNALKGRYIGNVDRLAERIRGELLNATRVCPVLGQITTRMCQDQRGKPFHSANPTAVQLWKACRTCPHNPKAEPAEGATA